MPGSQRAILPRRHRVSVHAIGILALVVVVAWPSPALAAKPTVQPGLPTLQAFTASVMNGDAGTLRGVYADDLFALPVLQQPRSYPDFVSGRQNSVTQYGLAADFGSVGLLAHNYLSGRYFFDLHPGQRIELIYGQGRVETYRVMGLYAFQAETPLSPRSDFIDLEHQQRLTATELFEKIYAGSRHLIFQTCIERDGSASWGRLFVTAIPAQSLTPAD